MPVTGPDYNKDRADKVANELLDKFLEANRLLRMPESFRFEDLRSEYKENFIKAVHKLFELDSWEGW